LVELALGNPNEAESYMQLALDRNAKNAHALLGMANLAIGRRDYKAAEGYLLEVVALDPDDVEANFDLGALYFQMLGQPAKAVGYWQRFVDLQPDDREAPRIRKLIEKLKAEPKPEARRSQ
jgi:tetratricopeptide (TPR) repeat protein